MKKLFLLLMISTILAGLFYSSAWADGRRGHGKYKWYEFWKDHDNDYEDDHEDNDDHEKHEFHGRRFYKARRISRMEAKEIVSDSFPHWYVGEGWEKKKEGRIELIIPLLYKGQIIGDIKINPVTGEIIPEKTEHSYNQVKISLDQARNTTRRFLPEMKITGEVRLGKHGNFWEVPLVFEGKEVEEIKVGTGSGHILPDWHKEEEAYYYRGKRLLDIEGHISNP